MERIYSLHLNDIIRFQSEGSYTQVYLKEGKRIMVSRLLKEFDDILSKDGFIRVHQSHLINEDFIFCFEKSENSITMKDNSVVPVSVRKKEQLLSLLNSI
jgi:two-component system, LytTR family, response regulator